MSELEKAGILIVRKMDCVKYKCPKCGQEVEVDNRDFMDKMINNYLGDFAGNIVICDACGAEFQIDKVEVE